MDGVHGLSGCLPRGQRKAAFCRAFDRTGGLGASVHACLRPGARCEVAPWMARAVRAVDGAVDRYSSLADTPFPHFLSTVLAHPRFAPDREWRVLVTYRDPVEWAQHRLREHTSFFCRHAERDGLANPFDLRNCSAPYTYLHEAVEQYVRPNPAHERRIARLVRRYYRHLHDAVPANRLAFFDFFAQGRSEAAFRAWAWGELGQTDAPKIVVTCRTYLGRTDAPSGVKC